MRNVRALNTMYSVNDRVIEKGEVLEVEDYVAEDWVRREIAEFADGTDHRGRIITAKVDDDEEEKKPVGSLRQSRRKE